MKSLIFVLSLAFSSSALTNPLQEAYGLLDKGDYTPAIKMLMPLANENNPPALFALGVLAKEGWGMMQNQAQANIWFERAAQSGHPEAAYELANSLRKGLGGQQDFEKAIEWYEFAGIRQHAQSQFELGAMYYYGVGTEQDKELGLIWIKKAAGQNHAMAVQFMDQL